MSSTSSSMYSSLHRLVYGYTLPPSQLLALSVSVVISVKPKPLLEYVVLCGPHRLT